MWAFLQSLGRCPSSYDFVQMIINGSLMEGDISLNTRGWKPSGPADLVTFSSLSFFSMIFADVETILRLIFGF